jgi:hypothetical protein
VRERRQIEAKHDRQTLCRIKAIAAAAAAAAAADAFVAIIAASVPIVVVFRRWQVPCKADGGEECCIAYDARGRRRHNCCRV